MRTTRPIIIRSAVNPRLLQRTLRVPYTLWPGACDTGIVQKSSIEQDNEATVAAALDFYADFDARVEREIRQLGEAGVALIVGDIPPLAFEVGHRLQVPTVAISNFTWDWIYESHPGFLPAGSAVLDLIRGAYRRATFALRLPFSGGFEVFPHAQPIPLVARRPRHTRDETRAHFGWPASSRLALLSFGGYGLPALDTARMDWTATWTVVTSDRIGARDASGGTSIQVIGDDAFPDGAFRYEDLVAAADVVLSKPGYGIVSECIATGTPLLYTSRGAFREYEIFVREMPQALRCRFISQEDLFAGRWLASLEAAVAADPPARSLNVDGADVAADILVRLASDERPDR